MNRNQFHRHVLNVPNITSFRTGKAHGYQLVDFSWNAGIIRQPVSDFLHTGDKPKNG